MVFCYGGKKGRDLVEKYRNEIDNQNDPNLTSYSWMMEKKKQTEWMIEMEQQFKTEARVLVVVIVTSEIVESWALKQEVLLARNMKLEVFLLVAEDEDGSTIRSSLRELSSGLEILIGGAGDGHCGAGEGEDTEAVSNCFINLSSSNSSDLVICNKLLAVSE